MQDLINFFQANSALVLAIQSHRPRSAAGLSRTGTARDRGRSASILTQKHADRRGRGQSVPRPVLRPALC